MLASQRADCRKRMDSYLLLGHLHVPKIRHKPWGIVLHQQKNSNDNDKGSNNTRRECVSEGKKCATNRKKRPMEHEDQKGSRAERRHLFWSFSENIAHVPRRSIETWFYGTGGIQKESPHRIRLRTTSLLKEYSILNAVGIAAQKAPIARAAAKKDFYPSRSRSLF